MRWYETTSRILLILSIVNSTLAAPVALGARDIHEFRADIADVARQDGTALRSPEGSEYTGHWVTRSLLGSSAEATANNVPPSPGSSTGSNSVPSSPDLPSGSHGGGSSPEYGAPPDSHVPMWDSDRMTLSSQWLVDDPDNPPTPESVARPLTPQQSGQASSTESPPSKNGHPPPSPGPDVNPPPGSVSQHPIEDEAESFLDKLLKGKIRRHISDPVATDMGQRELQDTVDSTASDLAKNLDYLATSATSGVVGRGVGMP